MPTRLPPPIREVATSAQVLALRTVGRLSHGVRLGFDTGFDSGLSLDYAYRNQASGRWLVGRWIDRAYLNAKGWRAIRDREGRVKDFIVEAMNETSGQSSPPYLLDIACGGGRYVFKALDELNACSPRVLLCDLAAESLETVKQETGQRGLHDIVTEQRDGFDATAFDQMQCEVDVAVASGFYELCDNDSTVSGSLNAMAKVVRPGGYFIYTGYQWHPQAAAMARSLPRWGGGRCDYPIRDQQALNAMVADAGYEILKTESDRWEMFTVSLARRM